MYGFLQDKDILKYSKARILKLRYVYSINDQKKYYHSEISFTPKFISRINITISIFQIKGMGWHSW